MTPDRFAHLAQSDTLPKLLRHNARVHGREIALREKEHGKWQTYDWDHFHRRAKLWGLGLASLGVAPGDAVAIIGESRPDWVAAGVGVHGAGAMSLGLYQDALDTEIAYLLAHAEVTAIVAEDEEQVDKMLRAAALGVPSLKAIIYCDPRGMRKYSDPRLISRDALFETATRIDQAEPARWDAMVDATRGDATAVLCSTSGTTSNPKLVAIASGSFIAHVANYCRLLGIGAGDEYVSVLPMAWIGEQFMGFYQPIVARHTLNFVEEPDTMMADLREIAPTFMLLAPRVWERIAADVRAQMMDASAFKRRVFEFGLGVGLRAVEQGRTSRFSQGLVLRALRDRLGFSRLRFASTGGAAMGPETFKFFMAMGVPMLQLYGQTELGGIYCTQVPGRIDFDSVGRGIGAEYKIRIDGADANGVGEIVSQHPYMFQGYYKGEAAAQADFRDGWMHTGDAGYIKPSGEIVVIDRVKDLAVMATGERFSPQFIENKLKFSPYISEAVILGDGRAWPAAIVCIRFPVLSKWAEQKRMSFTTYSDLAARPETYALIEREIGRVNATLPPAQKLRKFVLLYKELDADDGELTRTRKVRRGFIAERYQVLVDALYGGATHQYIETQVKFEDGRSGMVAADLKIVDTKVFPSVKKAA